MPQLDTMSWLSQIFWVFFFFLIFYTITLKTFLPILAQTMKARKKKIAWDNTSIDSLKGEDSSIFAKQENVIARTLLINKETLQKSAEFNESWINTNVEKANQVTLLNENQNYLSILGSNYLKNSVLGSVLSKN